ncbi:transporter substrate-binding domain-containing protein [Pseudodesulfovibrio sp. JC047]|uniref:ATP-binding protein n=1 Tax=Pseudodesulfovibrio sp. JC047 TaxID=2683199 RepID=UPI0013D2D0E6|nr:transporter substrate-binding domain-containing protein [Pseudodesulfovibrio sp. JC047]NDV20465.1 transporter substrate-binding domain-containing protein [Pseudodesulfovibrio sp. JC047]
MFAVPVHRVRPLAGILLLAMVWCGLFSSRPAVAQQPPDHFTAVILANFPPLYITTREGQPDGFALDVLKAVSKQADFEYELLVVNNWVEAIDAIVSGKADFIPGIGLTAPRKKHFLYTDVFETVSISCFVRTDSTEISRIEDLPGHRIAVIDKTLPQARLGTVPGVTLLSFSDVDEALFSLLSGKSDALFFAEAFVQQRAREIGIEHKVRALEKPFLEVKRGYILPKDRTALRDRLDTALHAYMISSDFNKTYLKWRGGPTPYWTAHRVASAGLIILILTVIGFSFWRWISVSRLNTQLQQSMDELVETQTQLQAREAQLITAKEHAEAASTSKSEFLATMSHELRTPLNGIMGMLQLMTLEKLEPTHTEYVETALQSCKNLARLIGDILDLSKVEAGKMELALIPFNPKHLLESVRDSVVQLAREKELTLSLTLDDDVPECVIGDPARLRQVLINLVGNAIKFTEQGTVSIEVTQHPSQTVKTTRLIFSVSDTGIGIPEAMQQEIFGAFTQVSGTAKAFQGTGLGLHIVKQLVTLMDGDIAITSTEGHGTTITFSATFELDEQGRTDSPKPDTPSGQDIQPRHILIVEDERVNQIAISKLVERLGHTTDLATNGKMAMHMLMDTHFDLILMDIQMPIMNGIETTRRIRSSSEKRVREVPIIALTAHAMSGDREKFLTVGMDDYLAKPVSIDRLKTILEALFAT